MRSHEALTRLKELQEKLFKIHLQLLDKFHELEKENRKGVWKEWLFKQKMPELHLEKRELKHFESKYEWNISKGILSPSFTQSLIYHLEQSLKEHQGD